MESTDSVARNAGAVITDDKAIDRPAASNAASHTVHADVRLDASGVVLAGVTGTLVYVSLADVSGKAEHTGASVKRRVRGWALLSLLGVLIGDTVTTRTDDRARNSIARMLIDDTVECSHQALYPSARCDGNAIRFQDVRLTH